MSALQEQIPQQIVEEVCEWAIMNGVAIKNADNSARHCPFSIAPIAMPRGTYQHLQHVTPLISKLISKVSEDHAYLQSALSKMAKSDPFFDRLMSMHKQIHGTEDNWLVPARKPLLLMRTDFMDDRVHGAKVIEFNGIAAGMGPFGQKVTELHRYIEGMWPDIYRQWAEIPASESTENTCLEQLAFAIAKTAKEIRADFSDNSKPTFLMVVQEDEDNVYDQHLLESALQKLGVRTVRRTFDQLSSALFSGEGQSLFLNGVGAIDVVYLRAGYQYCDYYAPEKNEPVCCHTLSQTRVFIEQHHVAVNATVSQQLATSKTMQMLLTMMSEKEYQRWGIDTEDARLIKSVLADMRPINSESIAWFNTQANAQEWVLKNQGEGGGHCIFGSDISNKLSELKPEEYNAWALMLRLFPHERERPTLAIRDGQPSLIENLVSEIGLFTAFYDGKPMTNANGYAGYLVRSKPSNENEGGVHSGKGMLDSITLKD